MHAREVTFHAKLVTARPHPDAPSVELWTVEAKVGEETVGVAAGPELLGALGKAIVEWVGTPITILARDGRVLGTL